MLRVRVSRSRSRQNAFHSQRQQRVSPRQLLADQMPVTCSDNSVSREHKRTQKNSTSLNLLGRHTERLYKESCYFFFSHLPKMCMADELGTSPEGASSANPSMKCEYLKLRSFYRQSIQCVCVCVLGLF
jgi:hypothetical protein